MVTHATPEQADAAAAIAPGARWQGGIALGVYSAIVLSPNVFAVALAGWMLDERALALLCSTLFLWVAWFALVRSTYWASAMMLPAVLFVPVELHLLASYDARLTSATWGVIFESNIREATEFLHALDGGTIVACGMLLALALACLRAIARSRLQWRHRSRYWILITIAFTLLGFHFAFDRQNAELGTAPTVEAFLVDDGTPAVLANVSEAFPLSLAVGIEQYVAHRRALEQQTAKLRQAPPFSAHQAMGAGQRQTYVLVIGETGRADRWGINGYHRPTSPRLSAQSNLTSITDMASVTVATRLSVPVILSGQPVEAGRHVAPAQRSLISAFKEAGFSTYWLSNQAPIGIPDTPISIHAREADHVQFLNYANYFTRTPFDGVLIPELAKALQKPEAKQLIVLHTLGSHFNYAHRYPADFEQFRPAGGNVARTDVKYREPLNNAYDNSILYTDYFLSEVIRELNASGRPLTAMWYVADHGDDLFEPSCKGAGNGRATTKSHHVATFFWHSEGYREAFPEKLIHLRNNRQRRVTTESMFASVLDTAAIGFARLDSSRSLLSPAFAERPRMVRALDGGLFDFDKAASGPTCKFL